MPKHTDRTRHIDVSVTPEEQQTIRIRAAQCGLSMAEYLRQLGLGKTKPGREPKGPVTLEE